MDDIRDRIAASLETSERYRLHQRCDALRELDRLLEKNPDVARILDLVKILDEI